MTAHHSSDSSAIPFLVSEQLPLTPTETLFQSRKLMQVPILLFAEISNDAISVCDVALEDSLTSEEKINIGNLFPSMYTACRVIGTTGQTIIMQNFTDGLPESMKKNNTISGSIAGVPVTNNQNELIGALCCFDTAANAFSSDHVVNLQIFASAYHAAQSELTNERWRFTRGLVTLTGNQEIDDQIVVALVAAMNAHSQETSDHCARIPAIVEQIAYLVGLTTEQFNTVRAAAILHDIGKIGIPSSIIHKNGPLTDEEWVIMRKHPVIGKEILESCGGPLAAISPIVAAHHERWDGKGYPYGLKEEEIPQIARMISIADSFDAMVSDRPYRKALSIDQTIAELRRGVGTQFDPEMTKCFLDLLDREQSMFSRAA